MQAEEKYRLYAQQWVTVRTLSEAWRKEDADARRVYEMAHDWIEEKLLGRVREKDIRLTLKVDDAHRPTVCHADIAVFRDNLIGEYLDREHAEIMAKIKGLEDYTIVLRHSEADKAICDNGYVIL